MANFSSSNLMSSTEKQTRNRKAQCPYCGWLNYSTTKIIAYFRGEMEFECASCKKRYWKEIGKCKDV